jgi:hypothetical protein
VINWEIIFKEKGYVEKKLPEETRVKWKLKISEMIIMNLEISDKNLLIFGQIKLLT